MKRSRLKRQLRRQSGDNIEAAKLSVVAKRIGSLPQQHLDASAKTRIAEAIGVTKPPHVLRYSLAGGFALLFIFSMAVQMAQPGSRLYALKRRGENVRAAVQPSFKTELDERRKEIEDDHGGDRQNRGSGDSVEDSSGSSSDDSSGLDSTDDKTRDIEPQKTEDIPKPEDIKSESSGSGSHDDGIDN